MWIKQFVSLSSSVIAVIVTSACRGVMSPEQAALRGTYALVSVNGSALPADVIGDRSGRILLLSETMRLDGRGNATDDVTERDSLSSAPAQVFFDSRSLAYTVDGSTVHFAVRCGPDVSCIQFPEGTIVGSNEIDRVVLASGGVLQRFVFLKMP